MSLDWKIRAASGELRAATLYGEDAAAMVALSGDGAYIEWPVATGYLRVWTDGAEAFPAAESYDCCYETMKARRMAFFNAYETGRKRLENRFPPHRIETSSDGHAEFKRAQRDIMRAARAAAAAVDSARFAPIRLGDR